MHPDDVAEFFRRVDVGSLGRIIYEPVLIGRTAEGDILLEVNPDPYQRDVEADGIVRRWARLANAESRMDWGKVRTAFQERDGAVRQIGSMIGRHQILR
jgi:hypothetical protein